MQECPFPGAAGSPRAGTPRCPSHVSSWTWRSALPGLGRKPGPRSASPPACGVAWCRGLLRPCAAAGRLPPERDLPGRRPRPRRRYRPEQPRTCAKRGLRAARDSCRNSLTPPQLSLVLCASELLIVPVTQKRNSQPLVIWVRFYCRCVGRQL